MPISINFPDERLRTVAKPADALPQKFKIVDDMFETMYLEEGIITATQVDIHLRIVVIDYLKIATNLGADQP